jgi:hypothetical protein
MAQQWASANEATSWQDWANRLIRNLQSALQESTPEVGAIQEFVAVPTGWVLANGATFDAASLPILRQKLGTNVLPNLSTAYPASGLKVCIRVG